jgi:hypothetical protein
MGAGVIQLELQAASNLANKILKLPALCWGTV